MLTNCRLVGKHYFAAIGTQFLSNDLAALIAPFSVSPYYQTLGDKIVILDERLNDALRVLKSKDRQDKFFKQLASNREKEIFNIDFPDNVELTLREKLQNISNYIESRGMSWNIQIKSTSWRQMGSLEVYGLLPYRHFNHYISDYDIIVSDGQMRFQVKPEEPELQNKKKTQQPQDMVKEMVKSKQEKVDFFKRARSSANQISSFLLNKKSEKKQRESLTDRLKQVQQQFMKGNEREEHILVRDYECEIEGRFCLMSDGKALNAAKNEWMEVERVDEKLMMRLRTEAWMNKKESALTKKLKKEVVSDWNWVMKGNPWAWTRRFDED